MGRVSRRRETRCSPTLQVPVTRSTFQMRTTRSESQMGSSHTIRWKRRPRDSRAVFVSWSRRGHCQRDDREPARAPLFPLHPFSSYNTYYWCVFAPEEKVRLGEGRMCLIHVASLASSSAQAGLVARTQCGDDKAPVGVGAQLIARADFVPLQN